MDWSTKKRTKCASSVQPNPSSFFNNSSHLCPKSSCERHSWLRAQQGYGRGQGDGWLEPGKVSKKLGAQAAVSNIMKYLGGLPVPFPPLLL